MTPTAATGYGQTSSTGPAPSDLRAAGQLRHIGVAEPTPTVYVRLLVEELDITIIDASTGEIFREIVLATTRDYQPTAAPKGPRCSRR